MQIYANGAGSQASARCDFRPCHSLNQAEYQRLPIRIREAASQSQNPRSLRIGSELRSRYFGFFFGESEEAWRYQTNPKFQSSVVDYPQGAYHVGRGTDPLPDPSSV